MDADNGSSYTSYTLAVDVYPRAGRFPQSGLSSPMSDELGNPILSSSGTSVGATAPNKGGMTNHSTLLGGGAAIITDLRAYTVPLDSNRFFNLQIIMKSAASDVVGPHVRVSPVGYYYDRGRG